MITVNSMGAALRVYGFLLAVIVLCVVFAVEAWGVLAFFCVLTPLVGLAEQRLRSDLYP